ncbi:putative glycoside hydrolase [Selenihalanaerobacter shriftii]|uniref:DUF4015 domain-containing protein n=1 Tax=Selenihalanaerobacter shriftii TaxID=142842 RepID=A0A1T4QV79_9FIRM|nr:putative glycoside hydrolase [Selenihalanaerobacter shriftii]SKA07680.1 hypothetical protein SAMN02745118_02710 [Selenihalanaerobacter shriftii]
MKQKIIIIIALLIFSFNLGAIASEFNNNQPLNTSNILKKKAPIKGVYLTGWVAGSNKRVNELLTLINNTELNAVVIDIKDVNGNLSYNSKVDLAKQIDANISKIKNIEELLETFNDNGIYTIARIPVFKDRRLAKEKKYALKFYDKNEDRYKILSSIKWVNPYSKKVWDYNLDLAIEAVNKGFDEIQFDYIRFPSFVNLSRYDLAVAPANSKIDIITQFVGYAKERLNQYGTPISIDVFGLTTSINDLGIGQNFDLLSKRVDYISPMVYPSHYGAGVYGLRSPEEDPYNTILKSMQHAKNRLNGKTDKLRPWLQDFSLRHRYGVKEIKEQIQAANKIGLDSWLLWNPRSRYTWQAFLDNNMIINEGNS